MTQITSDLVQQLRKRTGVGMMLCKKALQATDGDIEAAVEHLRKEGLAKAEKKESRTAVEGIVVVESDEQSKRALLLEINCETDFVGRESSFQDFVHKLARRALALDVNDAQSFEKQPFEPEGQKTVEEVRKEMIARLGENIQINRLVLMQADQGGCVSSYVHGGRIGCMVNLSTEDTQLAKDIAMHITASHPVAIHPEQVPQEQIEKEKEIFRSQAQTSDKPEHIIEKMISGRVDKFINEAALVGQPFVKDPNKTVGQLLEEKGAHVVDFKRIELGEDKEQTEGKDFAQEVKEQTESGKK